MEKVLQGLLGDLDPKKILESMLPLEASFKIKVYQAKDKSFIIQLLPIEEKKE